MKDFTEHVRRISPELGDLYDESEKEDRLYDEWRQWQDDEREMILEEALDECLRLGLSEDHLVTLIRESGATSWGLRHSIKK